MLNSGNIAKIRGNVLFIILIAVALFSALTVAITQSDRGTNSLDRERGSINATDMMSYGATIEKAVARMMSTGTLSENSISFENDVWEFNDTTPTSPASLYSNCTSDTCKIFHPAGGGVNAVSFNSQALNTPVGPEVKSGHAAVWSIQVDGVGTTAADLVLVVSTIDEATCLRINDLLKIENPSNNPPEDSWFAAERYDGSFPLPGDTSATIGNLATQLRGKMAGCVRRAGGTHAAQDNYFYQVLLPR